MFSKLLGKTLGSSKVLTCLLADAAEEEAAVRGVDAGLDDAPLDEADLERERELEEDLEGVLLRPRAAAGVLDAARTYNWDHEIEKMYMYV